MVILKTVFYIGNIYVSPHIQIMNDSFRNKCLKNIIICKCFFNIRIHIAIYSIDC